MHFRTCVIVGWVHADVCRCSREPRRRCQILAGQRRRSDTCHAGLPHVYGVLESEPSLFSDATRHRNIAVVACTSNRLVATC